MLTAFLFCCSTVIGGSHGANILAIFPFTAKSHFTMFEPLLDELHNRGHNLTVLSHFPRSVHSVNYTDVSLKGVIPSMHSNISLANLLHAPLSLHENLKILSDDLDVYDQLLNSSVVQNFLKTNSRFDLIITEIFNTDLFLAFVHKFPAPFISMSACPLMPWAYRRFATPDNPAFVPVVFTPYDSRMYFMSRLVNFIYSTTSNAYYSRIMNDKSNAVARKYFPEVPPLEEIALNTSLILVNTHFSLHQSVPLSPNVIQVGGMHIRPPEKLDEGLNQFISEAPQGVILFSMGSMFKAESLPGHVFQAFHEAFAKVPQRVIWKSEPPRSHAVNLSKNILFKNWVPQRDILAHPNVKLFIYHGGLLGISEAVHSGVPILGIPLYGDMLVNMAAVVSSGSGISLPFRDISTETLYRAITQIMKHPHYKESALRLSNSFQDRPISPLRTAVYWTEYVIRHKGAPQLSSPAKHLNWCQLCLLDVISFCVLSIIVVLLITWKVAYVILELTAVKVYKTKKYV